MRYRTATISLALALGCGGQPVGGKVPAAKPAHVGGAAAAAAALITLADPDAARQRQEDRGGDRNKDRTKKAGGTVPEHILFAPATSDEPNGNREELPPCTKKASESKAKSTPESVDLFPAAKAEEIAQPDRCRDAHEEKRSAEGDDRAEEKRTE